MLKFRKGPAWFLLFRPYATILPLECQVDTERIDCRYGIASVVYAECGGGSSQFRSISGVMLPCFQVLYVDIHFQGLQADFGKQALVECIGKLYVTDTEEVAAFDVIIRIQVVDRVLGVQQRLGIGSTFPVPTVQPLFEVVELGEVVVIPRLLPYNRRSNRSDSLPLYNFAACLRR